MSDWAVYEFYSIEEPVESDDSILLSEIFLFGVDLTSLGIVFSNLLL